MEAMGKLWARLRGARHIELFAVMVGLALMLLTLSNGVKPYAADAGKSELEQRLERLLGSMEGVDGVSAMVTQGEDGEVWGAVIVAEGAFGVRTSLELQAAVQTLLNVDADRIRIIAPTGIYGGYVE